MSLPSVRDHSDLGEWQLRSTDLKSNVYGKRNSDKLCFDIRPPWPEHTVEYAHEMEKARRETRALMAIDLVSETKLPPSLAAIIDSDPQLHTAKPHIEALRKRRMVIKSWKVKHAKGRGVNGSDGVPGPGTRLLGQNESSSPRYHPYSSSPPSPIFRSREDDVIDAMSKMSIIATSFGRNDSVTQARGASNKEALKEMCLGDGEQFLGNKSGQIRVEESQLQETFFKLTLGNEISSIQKPPVSACTESHVRDSVDFGMVLDSCGQETSMDVICSYKMPLEDERLNINLPTRTSSIKSSSGLKVVSHKYGDDVRRKRRCVNFWS